MLERVLELLERLVVAQETIAKNSSGKPTDTSGLEAVTKTTKTETAAAKKKRLAAEKKAKEAAAAADADKSDTESSGSDDGEVGAGKAGESTSDADAVDEPSPEEVKAAQAFKKELLDIARGHDEYVDRIKAVLRKFKATAETVPADLRDKVKAAVKEEFESETDENI